MGVCGALLIALVASAVGVECAATATASVDNPLGGLADILQNVLKRLLEALPDIIGPDVVRALFEIVKDLIRAVEELLKQVFNSLGQLLSKLSAGLDGLLKEIIDAHSAQPPKPHPPALANKPHGKKPGTN